MSDLGNVVLTMNETLTPEQDRLALNLKRLIDEGGPIDVRIHWTENAAKLTVEQRAAEINRMLEAPAIPDPGLL